MKKFVIIALIFALAAGAAFAQDGSWSVSGSGEIGFMLNFAGPKVPKSEIQADKDGYGETPNPYLLKDNAKLWPLIGNSGYNYPGWYGGTAGKLNVNYNKGGFSTGLSFESEHKNSNITGKLGYSDDTRKFVFEHNLQDILVNKAFSPGRLWGSYEFLDGVIHLEAAVKGQDNKWWVSSEVIDGLFGEGNWGHGLTFTKVDGQSFLLTEIAPIDGLKFGFQMRDVFASVVNGIGVSNNGVTGYNTDPQKGNTHVSFIDDALLQTRIGAQFATGPINIAAQFALLGKIDKLKTKTEKVVDVAGKEYNLTKLEPVVLKEEIAPRVDPNPFTEPVKTLKTGVYLGATIGINDNLNAGLAVQGVFNVNEKTENRSYAFLDPVTGGPVTEVGYKQHSFAFGGNVGFNSGALSAGLAVGLQVDIDPTERVYYPTKKTDSYQEQIGIQNKTYTGIYDFAIDADPDNSNSVVKKGSQSVLAVAPDVTFTLVPNYLAASLDAKFTWKLGIENSGINDTYERKYQAGIFGYEVTPQLWFNVTGTGISKGYYGNVGNGIIVRYTIAGSVDGSEMRTMKKVHQSYSDANSGAFNRPTYNALDVTFRWAF